MYKNTVAKGIVESIQVKAHDKPNLWDNFSIIYGVRKFYGKNYEVHYLDEKELYFLIDDLLNDIKGQYLKSLTT